MGSMINLAVGRLEIDWGKNNGFADHSALFQAGDVMQIPYYYAGKEIVGPDGKPDWEVIIEMQEGLSKPLSQVIDRINLLGHTTAVCEREFSTLASFNGFDPNSFSFSDLRTRLPLSTCRHSLRITVKVVKISASFFAERSSHDWT
jgi:HEPN/Toprim N-terminal domain 1